MKNKRYQRDLVIVTTTSDNRAKAIKMANAIVATRLAACVQIVEIGSIYRWKGKVESASEYLLLAKTRRALGQRLVTFIKKHHTYELPEVAILPIIGGLDRYLDWIREETKSLSKRRTSRNT